MLPPLVVPPLLSLPGTKASHDSGFERTVPGKIDVYEVDWVKSAGEVFF